MKSMYNKIFLKKHQWLFSFIIFISVGVSQISFADNPHTRQFACTYKHIVDYINSLISFDRDLMAHYLSIAATENLTYKNKIDLVTILMQYHLLPLDETNQQDCKYYKYLCFSKLNTVHHYARRYLDAHSDGGYYCIVNEEKYPLLSETCRLEIEKRIQPIPYPLAIAQAALESSWGRSNFSQNNRNYFGLQTLFNSEEKVISDDQCTPNTNNAKACVYHFKSVETGFFTYSQILNSRSAYKKLREMRYQHKPQWAHKPCELANRMVSGLEFYASDTHYLQKVRRLIKNICSIVNNC